MERFVGIFGIIVILGICFWMSNNKKKISLKTVISGLFTPIFPCGFYSKSAFRTKIIEILAIGIEKILHFSNSGADFVFGFLNNSGARIDELFYPGASFLFAIKVMATIILLWQL